VFEPVITKILDVYQPSAVVLQCGADSLAGDKLGCFNLTMHGHAHCVQFLRKYNVPLILLGGGGYTVKNVARTWTYETACALGIEGDIDPNLPWNQYFEWFGPRYRLEVVDNNMDDLNVKEGSLDVVRTTALEQLQQLACAPSVPMQDVPRESLGQHFGFGRDEEEGRDELDDQLAQHARYVYNLQDTDTTSEDSDGSDSWDSDESSGSQNNWRRGPYRSSSASRINGRYSHPQPQYTTTAERRRMSLLTGKYYDIPIHENGFSHFDHNSSSVGKQPARRRFFPDGPGSGSIRWDDVVGVVDASVNLRMAGGNNVDGFGNEYSRYAMVPELVRIMERGVGGGGGGGGGLDGLDGEDGEPEEGEDYDEDVPMST